MINAGHSLSKPRILIVEDENIVALDIERGLSRLGYIVLDCVDNGADAVKQTNELRPDIILMDIQLKGAIDGIDAANEIYKKFNIPVVFLTAYADESTLLRAKTVEPYAYILKPFEETELYMAIEVVLQKHRSIEERQALSKAALILSEERFKLFVESVKDGALFMLDIFGNIISWNAGGERIKGYTAEEIIGKNFRIFYEERDILDNRPENELKSAARNGRYEEQRWRIKKDGSRYWANVIITALKDENGILRGYGKIVQDLTIRKQADEKLKKTLQERDIALINLKEIIQGRDEFMSIASHELKTPLTSLLLSIQSLNRRLQNKHNQLDFSPANNLLCPENITEILLLCETQGKKLATLIEDLMDLAQIRLGKLKLNKQKMDLAKITRDTVYGIQGSHSQSTISVDTAMDVIGKWDPSRLEQVITNLVTNAIKYGSGNPIQVSVCVDRDNNLALILVKDHGIGIPLEFQSKIFNRFERGVSASVGGLGLGLYISRKIIEAHEGKISVHSALGRGSIFTIILPLSEEK